MQSAISVGTDASPPWQPETCTPVPLRCGICLPESSALTTATKVLRLRSPQAQRLSVGSARSPVPTLRLEETLWQRQASVPILVVDGAQAARGEFFQGLLADSNF